MTRQLMKDGLDYRVWWDSVLDVLQTEHAEDPDPLAWQTLENGIEAGYYQSTESDTDRYPNRAPEYSIRNYVVIRMTEASRRPSLPVESIISMTVRQGIPVGLVNELRQGHTVLLEKLRSVGKAPLSLLEAGDQLAEVVRAGFGDTRTVNRTVRAAGFEDHRDWLDDALGKYDEAKRRT